MSSHRLLSVACLVALLSSCWGGAALAGEVLVKLVESDGTAVRYQTVQLHSAPESMPWRGFKRGADTDLHGVARFRSLPSGPWRVQVPTRALSRLVPPRLNPIRPEPVVHVGESDSRQEIEVVLDRGSLLRFGVSVDVDDPARTSLLFHHVDTGFEMEAPMRLPGEEQEMVLAPGRWRAGIKPPPGYLLVDVTVDDWSLPGAEASLESRADDVDLELAFHLSGRARVVGKLSGPNGCGAGGVVARLIEPGPWFEAVTARGGSEFREVEARVDHFCRYEQVLPDGTWLVRPLGDDHESVEPPERQLVIPRGGAGLADFSIEPSSGDGDASGVAGLFVRVLDPEGRWLQGAVVEVSRPGEAEALRTGRTSRYGYLALAPIPIGPIRIVAGSERFLDAELQVKAETWAVPMAEFQGRTVDRDRMVSLTLEAGPLMDFVAEEEDGGPLIGARLKIEALDEPQGLLREPELAGRRRARELRTDAEGSARLEGLYPGMYRVRAELLGQRASTHLVRVGAEAAPRVAEVELEETGSTLVPLWATRVGRVLVPVDCEEGLTLPTVVDVRVIRAFVHAERPGEERLLKEATLALDDHPLVGEHREELAVGPLEGGAWLMAFRPAGFDRWTWYPGGEDSAEAEVLYLDSDDDTPLERIGVDCGPAFSVALIPADHLPLPDMARARVEAEWEPRDELRRVQGRGGKLLVERRRDSVLLRGVEAGPASLRAELSHPLLAPERIRFTRDELELEAGERHVLEAPVRVLGAVAWEARVPGRLVLTPSEGEPREQAVEAGAVLVPRMAPGRWCVSLHAPGSQGALLAEWSEVLVEAGRINRLPDPRARNAPTSRSR